MVFAEIRRQVAILGQVTDAQTDQALAGAQVTMTDAPTVFVDQLVGLAQLMRITDPSLTDAQTTLDNPAATRAQRLQAAQTILDFLQARRFFIQKRPDRTQTAADGFFFFVDLPAGSYTLAAALSNAGSRYGTATTTAAITINNGDIVRAAADMTLSPTTVRGQVTGPALNGGVSGPVHMAAIQMQGSGEMTYSDSNGDYLLTGVEIGSRTLLISARGYQPQEQGVTFNQAGAEQIVNITLTLPP